MLKEIAALKEGRFVESGGNQCSNMIGPWGLAK